MIEEDAVADEHIIGFAIVDNDPECVHFGDSIRRAGVEGSRLFL